MHLTMVISSAARVSQHLQPRATRGERQPQPTGPPAEPAEASRSGPPFPGGRDGLERAERQMNPSSPGPGGSQDTASRRPRTRTCSAPPRSSSSPPRRRDLLSREQLAAAGGRIDPPTHPLSPPRLPPRSPSAAPSAASSSSRAAAITSSAGNGRARGRGAAAPPRHGAMEHGRRAARRRGGRRGARSLDTFAAEAEAALRGAGACRGLRSGRDSQVPPWVLPARRAGPCGRPAAGHSRAPAVFSLPGGRGGRPAGEVPVPSCHVGARTLRSQEMHREETGPTRAAPNPAPPPEILRPRPQSSGC